MTGRHDKTRGESPFTSDLERNPGVGQSKGAFATGEDPELLEGENTVEGDLENAANPHGGVNEHQGQRTNK